MREHMPGQRFAEVVRSFRQGPPPRPELAEPRLHAPPPARSVIHDCAFCGRSETEAWQIIAGRAGHICGDCALEACAAMADGGSTIPPHRLREALVAWERVGNWLLAQKRRTG